MELAGARVLVTGGHGFLGRRVCATLERADAVVLAPRSAELDLLDRPSIRAWLDAQRPDLVVHLAARVGGIGANQVNPAAYFHDNLMMGVQLIDECWRAKTPKVVAIGTVCAYPKHTPVPFTEDALWDGYPEETNAPYGLAKKMLLVQAQAYRAQYGFNCAVLFPANLYGPRDNFDPRSSHVVPALIRKIDEAKRTGASFITVWGDGTPTRELLFVDDCAHAVVLAAERYDSSEPLNIGNGREVRIADLAALLMRIMEYRGELRFDPSKPNGQPRRSLDVTRARERIGFDAIVSLEDGLRRTVDWYLQEGPR